MCQFFVYLLLLTRFTAAYSRSWFKAKVFVRLAPNLNIKAHHGFGVSNEALGLLRFNVNNIISRHFFNISRRRYNSFLMPVIIQMHVVYMKTTRKLTNNWADIVANFIKRWIWFSKFSKWLSGIKKKIRMILAQKLKNILMI